MTTKPLSLVERKKQQWAKEKEELANLGTPFRHKSDETFENRSKYGSRLIMMHKQLSLDNCPKEQSRRSSLPPLYKNQYSSNNFDYQKSGRKDDRGGETSGYGSDNNASPEYRLPPGNIHNQWYLQQHQQQQQQSGYESSTSLRDDRPKWGDKGVGLGKFTWQSKEEQFDINHEPPNWVKRGLQADGAIVVANSSSPSVSPEDRQHQCEEQERPCTGSSYSMQKSHIRGQNVPLDAAEIAERERKRQIALAHQDAIRQQLQEREKRRQEERERRIQEEKEEDLRIEREQEYERQKRLQEARAQQEKLERDKKRKQAIQEAVELAEKEAQMEKMRLKMMKKNTNIDRNITENVKEVEKLNEENEGRKLLPNKEQLNNSKETVAPIKSNEIIKEITNNLIDMPENKQPASSVASEAVNNERNISPVQASPRHRMSEQFNYLLQPSMTDNNIHNFHYALLIPTAAAQYPIAIPVNLTQSTESIRTENRLLTPTRYRNNIRKCDSSTQTDDNNMNDSSCSSAVATAENVKEKYLREKLTNLDLNEDKRIMFRRSRSENADERPKWGVNRPPTRYLKQSEKDPLYLRRKLRQKREVVSNKSYDEKNSSDDSQTGTTPRRYRKKEIIEKRTSRARWRNLHTGQLEQLNSISSRDMGYQQRELIPLESDKDQLYYKCCCVCRCRRHHHHHHHHHHNQLHENCSSGVDILKIPDIETPTLS